MYDDRTEPTAPAVVVGANLNALGVARSLRAAGIPVTVLGTSMREPAVWARGTRAVLTAQLDGPALVDALLSLRGAFTQAPVLVLTDEAAVFTVSQHRSALEEAYRFILPSPEMVLALSDKAAFQTLAETHDLPAPHTAVLETAADLTKLKDLAPPVIIKPSDKRGVHAGRTARIHLAESRDTAERLCREMLEQAGTVIAQEWIPGPDNNIVFCLFYARQDGEILSLFTGRKLRSDPPGVGSTGLCVAAPEIAPAVAATTRRFVRAVGFAGLGSLEFKWHAGRGAFLVIEPTVGRTDWQEEIATLCGENIPYQAYRHACGLPPPPRESVRSAAWRASFRQRWPKDASDPVERIWTALWRVDDPMPALAALADAGLRRIERLGVGIGLGTPPRTDGTVPRKYGF